MNIFGKEVEEYRIFADAFPQGTTRALMQDSITRGGRNINWAHQPRAQQFADAAEAVTAAFGIMSNNLQAVQAETDEILRRDFQLNEFIPINQNVPEGATSKRINIVNRHGKGKFINKNGSNVERSDVNLGSVTYPIEYAGIIASWSLQELRESLFAGVSLSNEAILAAVQGCNDHIQEVGFTGSAEEGFTGLLNSTDVTLYAGADAGLDWTDAGTTADMIVAYVRNVIADIGNASNEVVYRQFRNSDLQVALPTVAFDILTNTKYGTNADRTIWEFLKMNNPWTTRTGRELVLKSLPEAATAGASSDARMLVYPKDPRVLEMDMPIAPRVTQVINNAYSVDTPYEYSISGTNIKRGSLMRYGDGILG